MMDNSDEWYDLSGDTDKNGPILLILSFFSDSSNLYYSVYCPMMMFWWNNTYLKTVLFCVYIFVLISCSVDSLFSILFSAHDSDIRNFFTSVRWLFNLTLNARYLLRIKTLRTQFDLRSQSGWPLIQTWFTGFFKIFLVCFIPLW